MQFKVTESCWNYNNTRLTNQIFKALPLYEQEEDWAAQIQTVLYELKGYNDAFKAEPSFMILIGRLTALYHAEDKFAFRKLIFESIAALKEIKILN